LRKGHFDLDGENEPSISGEKLARSPASVSTKASLGVQQLRTKCATAKGMDKFAKPTTCGCGYLVGDDYKQRKASAP
jgi:hypothetical protein